jgi:GntR family transcriptional regulator
MHRQLAQQLREAIGAGRYRPGDRLPAEPELAARHGVSRITARQAVMQLVRDDLVVRRQGKGTFVAEPPVHHDLVDLRGIYDELVARGVNPTTELLDYAEIVAPANVAERLRSGARRVLHYKRLYLRRGEPFAVSWAYLSPAVPKMSRELVAAHTTYHLFESFMHLKISHADLSVRARAASPELRRLLRLRPGTPLIALERVSYLADGTPAEFTLYCANAENYEFALRVRGKVPITPAMQAVP